LLAIFAFGALIAHFPFESLPIFYYGFLEQWIEIDLSGRFNP
jgi:hypothetical protein